MTRATFKVLFYIKRTKVLSDGKAPIFARITVNRQRAEFGLQRSIELDGWDNKKGAAGGLSKKTRELNSYLDFVRSKLYSTKLEIEDLCGIEKNLSTHTARHTFATTVTLSNQVSIEVVSKMLGHSSINMTKKYARVVDDLISKDMQKIYSKYEGVRIN